MRSMCAVFALLSVCGLATMAAGAGPFCGCESGAAGYAGYAAYCAPACAGPAYGLAPGCCEFPPSCCEHVWDGYCQERHCGPYLFRGRFFSGASCFHGGVGYCGAAPECDCVGPAVGASEAAVGVIDDAVTPPAPPEAPESK
jgi:hypothetical protein